MKLFPPLQKKIEAYKEEKKDKKSLFHPNPNPFTKGRPFSKRSRENGQKKGNPKVRKLDVSRFSPPKAKRPANIWAPLSSTKVTMTTTINTMTRTASPKMNTNTNPLMTSACRTCKRWRPPCPFCVQSSPHPLPVESDWSVEDWDGDKQ